MPRIVPFLLFLVCPFCLRAQTTLYVTSGNGNESTLYTVNPSTAQATLVGNVVADVLGVSTGLAITGLAFHPITGVLYGVTGREIGPSRQLVTINPLTAQAAIIGGLGGVGASDISFAANGTLYAWATGGGQLLTLNLVTGQYTAIGSNFTNMASSGLAFTPDGTLYVATNSSAGSTGLWIDNPVSGAVSFAALFSGIPANFGKINALASDPNGLLFATGNSSSHDLVTINPTTGIVTSMGILTFGEADALAFQFTAVPEPSVVALLLGLGIFGYGLLRRCWNSDQRP